jgi:hypothetical protein
VGSKQQHEAEARKAWDVLMQFVNKFVGNDVYGNYGPEHGWYPKTFPQLNPQILDTVRRTGGWRAYSCMTNDDFPFQQKRFFEEYEVWTAVQHIDASKLLTQTPALQLVGNEKRMSAAPQLETLPTPLAKRIPELLTESQLRDRREMLRQQTATLRQQTQR